MRALENRTVWLDWRFYSSGIIVGMKNKHPDKRK